MTSEPPPLANPVGLSACLPLVAGERVVAGAHVVEYGDLGGLGWLTTHRIMVRADRPNAALQARMQAIAAPEDRAKLSFQQFQLPLSNLTKVGASPDSQPKLLLRITFAPPGKPEQHVILRFTSTTAVDDRAKWKEVIADCVKRNAAQPPAAAAAASTAASSTPAASADIRVKLEPQAATPSSAASTPAPHAAAMPAVAAAHPATPATAPSTAAPRIPPAAAPAPLRAPGAAKRPHSALSTAPAPAAALPSGIDLQTLIRCRAALLARDPALQAVHAELVPSAMSEDEFWAGRTELLRAEQARQIAGSGSGSGIGQRAGISSAMASTIRPETGCNVVRYTLDASQIHAIFLENPMVYELYQQLVPDKLDEKAFWTRYFKSQYIHSQATTAVTTQLNKNPTEEDLFAKARAMQEAKENEELGATLALNSADPATAAAAVAEAEQKKDLAAKATLLHRRIDPSVDLTAADMSDAVMLADPTKAPSVSASSNAGRSKKARAQTELLRRFNRHGMLVLDSNLVSPAAAAARNNTHGPAAAAADATSNEVSLQASYHSSLAHSLDLTDLAQEVAPSYNQLPIGRGFFQSLGARKTAAAAVDSRDHAIEAANSFMRELAAFPTIAAPSCARHSVQHIPASLESRSILLDLTSTARGMNKAAIAAKQLRQEDGSSSQPQQQLIVFSTDGSAGDMLIPEQFRGELKKRFHTCNELFRHFWSSLNPRSGAKLQRVHAALDEQYRLLQVIRGSLNERGFSPLVPLLNPLIASIEMCASTFHKWQEKEAKRAAAPAQPIKRMTNAATAAAAIAKPNAAPMLLAHAPAVAAAASEHDQKRIKV